MKKYITPELEVSKMDVEDVITTSVASNTLVFDTSDPTANNYVQDVEIVSYTEIFAG